MESLLTINKTNVSCEEVLDLDTLFRERLAPLLHKFKSRLNDFEDALSDDSKRIQDYTLDKIKRTLGIIDTIDQEWSLRRKQHQIQPLPFLMQTLEQSIAELSEKYKELEAIISEDYFDNTIDDTMDTVISSIEDIDSRISDALDRASAMRHRVNEKIHDMADRASEQMDSLKNAIAYGAKRLLHYEELPEQWQNNKHIHTGYRFLSTPADCFHSLLYVHNETGNIYTHLIGFFVFFVLGVYELFYSPLLSEVPGLDRVVFAIFFLAACKCLMCSTVWHTLSAINNYETLTKMACLDYVGISVLICASIILTEYYGFYCEPMWRNTYMAGTGTLAMIGVVLPFMSWFDRKDLRWIRIAFFVFLASSCVLPVAHLVYEYGTDETFSWLMPVAKSLSCYGLGVVVYANHLPEAFWPGRFDHFGHSHQLWHMFVCGGIWYHYVAAVAFVGHRGQFGQCIANF
ncbi:hypothetical protein CLU79DRAFT_891238 [Phycomyces nitens]|nr:hypothetical protein CLU79DRAFT_891238 [Phycomyces nitens]